MSKTETTAYTLKKFIERKMALLRKFETEMREESDTDDDWDGIYAEWESVQ